VMVDVDAAGLDGVGVGGRSAPRSAASCDCSNSCSCKKLGRSLGFC
jgi:hypothetical protein